MDGCSNHCAVPIRGSSYLEVSLYVNYRKFILTMDTRLLEPHEEKNPRFQVSLMKIAMMASSVIKEGKEAYFVNV